MARTPNVVPFPWRGLLRTDGRRVIPDLANVLIALRHDPQAQIAYAFDEMQQSVMVMAQPPLGPEAEPGADPPRFIDPEDVTRCQEWLQVMGLPKIGREHVENALEVLARERPVHPIRNWLDCLEAEGSDRVLGTWLHHALGCPDDEYHRQIGAMFVIAMVARIFTPGVQADYMLVLEGPQGEEKSRFCRVLAGDDYFSDNIPKIDGDQIRVAMHMRGKWLIEVSELAAFTRADVELLKSFITRRVEIYTPKYGRKERREPRQCLLIGTTNDDNYIKDDTGGRRFWPVKVGAVNLDWLRSNRDRLFAEAVEAYRMGQQWWPDRAFEKAVIVPIQSERQFRDEWADRVLEVAAHLTVVTIAGVWQGLQSTNAMGDLTKLDMLAQKRIASILKGNGYLKRMGDGGKMVWKPADQTLPRP